MNLFPLFTSNPSFPMTVSICAASSPNKILCSHIFSSPPPNKVRFFSFLLLMEKSFFLWGEQKSFIFWPQGMWDLSSLPRDPPCTPCIGSAESSPPDHREVLIFARL